MIITKEEVFRKSENLPTISLASLELIQVIDRIETSKEDLIKLIELDEVLLASLFRFANSVVFHGRRAKNIGDIVDILGFKLIKETAIFLSAKTVICDELVWHQSVYVAIAAKSIARKMNKNTSYQDDIYMAALFESYGAMCLMSFYQDRYLHIYAMTNFDERLALEQEQFGINHLQLSYEILYQWGIPEDVAAIIKNQQDFLKEKYLEQNMIIEVAKLLFHCKSMEIEDIDKALLNYGNVHLLMNKYDLNPETIDESLIEEIDRDFNDALSFV